MRKSILLCALMAIAISASAQVRVEEPEFTGSYHVLTSDTTYEVLPKENGSMKQHKSKFARIMGKVGGVADVVMAGGALGAVIGANAGNISKVVDGMKVMETAAAAGDVATSVETITKSYGMDIVFEGGHSPYKITAGGKDLRVVVRNDSNTVDPLSLYRIVRFASSKKERSVQWLEIKPSLLGTPKSEKSGYAAFSGEKYGEHSYLLTVPAKELRKGEYGIIYMDLGMAAALPIATFSVE